MIPSPMPLALPVLVELLMSQLEHPHRGAEEELTGDQRDLTFVEHLRIEK